MSSSYRNCKSGWRSQVVPLLSAAALLMPALASAADWYWRPGLEARLEGHSNRDLAVESADEDSTTGYIGELELLLGRDTERTEFQVRPRIRYQDYQNRDGLERLEEFLDLRTTHRTLRSEFGLAAGYSRRDAYTAELVEAGFGDDDVLAPVDPADPGTGRILVDDTRERIYLQPSFTHRISPRTGFVTRLAIETLDYEREIPALRTDFDFGQFETSVLRQLDPRTELTAGAYVSRYDTADDSVQTDAYGLIVRWSREWTERVRGVITVLGERSDSDRVLPVVVNEKETSWGATLDLTHTGEVSRWRLLVGRIVTPSASGAKADADELRVDYERDISERLTSEIAARLLRVRSQSDFTRGNDRDYARADIGLRWAMTPSLSVGGGYELIWREFKAEDDSAMDNAIYISLRYQGLGPQR